VSRGKQQVNTEVMICLCVYDKYINLKITLARNIGVLYGEVQIPGMNNDFTDEIGKKRE